jgi:hydroxymethylbilane synthase
MHEFGPHLATSEFSVVESPRMPSKELPIVIATRGSALALAQANNVLAQCRTAFPKLSFELKIIKTTGDKLQTASLAKEGTQLPKGLFTKELEVALLKHKADLAVHSLKDLPTELPGELKLGAVGKRADVRDVLIYRDADYLEAAEANKESTEWTPGQSKRRGFRGKLKIKDLPPGTVVATASTRRKAQLLSHNAKVKVPDIRGNVVTRLQKLADRAEMDATILALAGITRLNFTISEDGRLQGDAVPDGLLATILDTDVMLPCVGQGAVGIEVREQDERIATICEHLNHFNTLQCVTAERAFLAAMGGGCQSPVAAYAEVSGDKLHMRALSFTKGPVQYAQGTGLLKNALELGAKLADELK